MELVHQKQDKQDDKKMPFLSADSNTKKPAKDKKESPLAKDTKRMGLGFSVKQNKNEVLKTVKQEEKKEQVNTQAKTQQVVEEKPATQTTVKEEKSAVTDTSKTQQLVEEKSATQTVVKEEKTTATETTKTATVAVKQETPTYVYYAMPTVGDTLFGAVGLPSGVKFTSSVMNFTSDVKYLQGKLKELGLLSEVDYQKENALEGEQLFVPTNYEKTDGEVPLSEIEKKFMLLYGKIPVGTQIASSSIPKTVEAIKVYQREVMKSGSADGRVNPIGATITSLQGATVEKVLAARNEYALLQKQKEEAAKKKAAEEKLKLEQQQKAAKEKQAYINSLKNAKTDEASIKQIYDTNIADMRVLGKEMRKYAPYNPILVIAMLKYMDYTESDNLAYNITSNFTDAQLATLDKTLLKTLKEYLEAGWILDAEQVQINRIDKLVGVKDKVVEEVKKGEKVEPTGDETSQAVAKRILASKRVTFATSHASTPKDNATPDKVIADVAAGNKAHTSKRSHVGAIEVDVDVKLLLAIEELSKKYTLEISEITGAVHGSKSKHYRGKAADIVKINGVSVNSHNPYYKELMKEAAKLGSTWTAGPGTDANHATHVHIQF